MGHCPHWPKPRSESGHRDRLQCCAGVGVIRRPAVMDGDPSEGRQDPGGVHPSDPAFVVHSDQGVLARGGRVHPPQSALDPEPGLIEMRKLRRRDRVADLLGELAQTISGPGGHPRDRPTRDRRSEQLGQRLGGALLGQELADVQSCRCSCPAEPSTPRCPPGPAPTPPAVAPPAPPAPHTTAVRRISHHDRQQDPQGQIGQDLRPVTLRQRRSYCVDASTDPS